MTNPNLLESLFYNTAANNIKSYCPMSYFTFIINQISKKNFFKSYLSLSDWNDLSTN